MSSEADETRPGTIRPRSRKLRRLEHTHKKITSCLTDFESARDAAGVLTTLDELLDILPEHFAIDEEGPDGVFDEVRSLRPSLDAPLKALEQEHREITAALEELRKLLHEAGEDFDPIREKRRACVDKIRDHERRESRIVLDAYFFDEGGSG